MVMSCECGFREKTTIVVVLCFCAEGTMLSAKVGVGDVHDDIVSKGLRMRRESCRQMWQAVRHGATVQADRIICTKEPHRRSRVE